MGTLVWALLALASAWGAPAAADELTVDQQVEMARAQTEAQRQATVAAGVPLTEQEAQKFWPLYREYRNEVASLNDETITLMKEFAGNFDALTSERAKSIADRWLAIEKQRIELKAKYADKYAKVLGGVKMARVLQIENKLDALVQVALAKTVPLVPAS